MESLSTISSQAPSSALYDPLLTLSYLFSSISDHNVHYGCQTLRFLLCNLQVVIKLGTTWLVVTQSTSPLAKLWDRILTSPSSYVGQL